MREVAMIPTNRIHIPNPRVRNQRQHRDIIANIAEVGLKRPITVSRREQSLPGADYDLVCGQGRLEAFQSLGYSEIPALVIDANEPDCMLMSLIENIARRQHTSMEHVREIERLHRRGDSVAQIAQKIGMTQAWVSMLVGLIDRGEDRLLIGVETGVLPISLATEFAKSDDAGVQLALANAYASGLKGKKLNTIRRLLEQRSRRGKTSYQHSGKKTSPKLTAEYLRRIYQREVDKQTLVAKKAEFVHSKLMFVVQAMKDLRRDKEFLLLLRAEGMTSLPQPLAERMGIGSAK